jgi:hypothetical protein
MYNNKLEKYTILAIYYSHFTLSKCLGAHARAGVLA